MKAPSFDNNSRTEHGIALAAQIQDEDAYGYTGNLTASDLWNLLDQFETHLTDTPELDGRDLLTVTIEEWKRELERRFPEMETVV